MVKFVCVLKRQLIPEFSGFNARIPKLLNKRSQFNVAKIIPHKPNSIESLKRRIAEMGLIEIIYARNDTKQSHIYIVTNSSLNIFNHYQRQCSWILLCIFYILWFYVASNFGPHQTHFRRLNPRITGGDYKVDNGFVMNGYGTRVCVAHSVVIQTNETARNFHQFTPECWIGRISLYPPPLTP